MSSLRVSKQQSTVSTQGGAEERGPCSARAHPSRVSSESPADAQGEA